MTYGDQAHRRMEEAIPVRGKSTWVDDQLATYAQPVEEEFEDDPVQIKGLHWYQWIVYTIVLITCLAVLYGMYETYNFIQNLRDALINLRSI